MTLTRATPDQPLPCNLMKTDLTQTLGNLKEAVITRSEVTPGTALIVVAREGQPSLRILLEGCQYQDTRCASCSCDPDTYRLTLC